MEANIPPSRKKSQSIEKRWFVLLWNFLSQKVHTGLQFQSGTTHPFSIYFLLKIEKKNSFLTFRSLDTLKNSIFVKLQILTARSHSKTPLNFSGQNKFLHFCFGHFENKSCLIFLNFVDLRFKKQFFLIISPFPLPYPILQTKHIGMIPTVQILCINWFSVFKKFITWFTSTQSTL